MEAQERKVAKLKRMEWQAIVRRAEKVWKKEIRRSTPGGVDWSPLRIIAAVLFILITLFTSAKAALHAIPVADAMYAGLIEGIGVTNEEFALIPTLNTFRALTVAVLVIISELGLVYFMLLSYTVAPRQINYGRNRKTLAALIDLPVIMSYMPRIVTYLMVAFVFYVSGKGGATLTLYDQFLPVFVGIGLTYFVEQIAADWDNHNADIRARLRRQWDDVDFLVILHDFIGEGLVGLVRVVNGRSYKPNEWLETSDLLEPAIQAEYRRNTVNRQFAETVRDVGVEQAAAAASTGVKDAAGLRIPPNGAARWTPETLWEDLVSMKARKGLQRNAHIRKWYAKGYGADTVWLEIAQKWNS